MVIRDKSGLFLLFLVLLAPLSFAQFRVVPVQTTFENAVASVTVTGNLYNDGQCDLDCSWGTPDGDGGIMGTLRTGYDLRFSFMLVIPNSCSVNEKCAKEVKFTCKGAQGSSCSGTIYEQRAQITFIKSKSGDYGGNPPIDQIDKAPMDNQISTTATNYPQNFIEATPSNSQLSDLVEGNRATMNVYLTNNGKCTVECTYKTQGTNYEEELITEGLNPGAKTSFNMIFFVPEGCTEPCSISAHVKCYDLASAECPTILTHETDVSFDLVNIRTAGDVLLGYVLLGAIMLVVGVAIYLILKRIARGGAGEAKGKFSSKERRRLSAIMFTDVKGFSKAVGQDEEATLRKMWKYEEIMGKIIKRHEGRIVKTIGDAIMGDFDSAVNAVKCAIDIQNTLRKEKFFVRIGIHLGDVIHKGGDVFGDGVNIASRVESIAEAGTVYVSEDVYNQVKNKIKAKFQDMGPRTLKNIEHPVKVYKVE